MRFLLQHGRLVSAGATESRSFMLHKGKIKDFIATCLVHKGKFWHFYAFGLTYVYFFAFERLSFHWKTIFIVQLLRRLLESIFLFTYSPASKMHILHYFVGITYYPALVESAARAPGTLHWMRIGLFCLFSMVQHYAHLTLGKASQKKGKRTHLNGGLFKYVWCPHYTAEVLCYWTLSCSPLMVANAVFTTFNLVVTAVQVQQQNEKREVQKLNGKEPSFTESEQLKQYTDGQIARNNRLSPKKCAIFPFIL
jgi:3-oxo-5-alpha-steroid 4-dehydrogenase 3